MKVFLVEGSYAVTRQVAVYINAVDEAAAEAELVRVMQLEGEASRRWLEAELGAGRLVGNTAEVGPELVMVSEERAVA
jgi:hypothetical protein